MEQWRSANLGSDLHIDISMLKLAACWCGRPLRIDWGALYHLTGQANARGTFPRQRDCAKFVQFLVDSLERYDVALHAFVLMGNHYHLIARRGRPIWVNGCTGLAPPTQFTSIDGIVRVGHLFQGRYKVLWWKRKAIF